MIFIYIFIGFFIVLALFLSVITYKKTRLVSTIPRLHYTQKWFSIDLVVVTVDAHSFVRRTSRPVMRTLLHGVLRSYLVFANTLRSWLRHHIRKLFTYYSEEHDRLYKRPASDFLAEMHAHKDKIKKRDTT